MYTEGYQIPHENKLVDALFVEIGTANLKMIPYFTLACPAWRLLPGATTLFPVESSIAKLSRGSNNTQVFLISAVGAKGDRRC